MPRLLQVFALLVLTLSLRPALGFSLLGPTSGDPGGEAWQVERIGHNLGGDEGSVKNLGEEYRWNQSVITYGFDPSFVNYFGSNGVAAIEAAIAVYNSLPDLSTLSQTLDEYPLNAPNGAITTFRDSRRINYSARALDLLDLKTFVMGTIAEQLGLAAPERYTWTLRARETTETRTNFNVIMRNFDPVTYMPSRYVNGSRYTYYIVDGQTISDAIELPADPESTLYSFTSVANIIDGDFPPGAGEYYTYLTRDDIGGLRYIYDANNLQFEQFAPGTQITAPDFTSITLLTNQDLLTFSLFTFENPPAVVQAAFPNIVIKTNSAFVTTEVQVVDLVVTNIREPWGDPFVTNFFLVPVLQTNPVIRYQYEFANVLTNYASGSTSTIFVAEVGLEVEPWSTPQNPISRTNVEAFEVPFPSGGFIIVPTNVAQFNFTGFSFTNVIAITNVVLATNFVQNGVPLRPISITEIVFFTNVTYAVYPFSVQPAPDSVLRGGIGKLNFQRLTNAVFTGTNWLHTNMFAASYITNGVVITNTFSRVNTLPDILFAAADLGTTAPIPAPFILTRGANRVSNADRNSAVAGQGGPGNVFGPLTITLTKLGPSFLSQIIPFTPTEEDAFPFTFWGSFDGSTNPPVVYPKDITLEDVSMLINGGLVP